VGRFVLVLALAACSAPAREAPGAAEITEAIVRHEALRPSDPSCAGVAGDRVTLGAIHAHLAEQLAQAQASGDEHSIAARCEGAGPWRCSWIVRVVADGDPWDYGIEFQLAADGSIDPSTIRCPGSG
jgi:hypothetical protein